MGRTYNLTISEFDLEALETELECTKRQLVEERELANRLEEENADIFLRRWAKAQERAIDAERERDKARDAMSQAQGELDLKTLDFERMREQRDQYKGLLIRLYNDLFVHHKGEAVRDFKALFREENYN